MEEKDEAPREEIIRNREPENEQGETSSEESGEIKKGQTEVKNANAAGLGSMGRNDENELAQEPPTVKTKEVEKY